MQVIASFDPAAASSGNIQVGSADPGTKLLLYNLSLVAIQLNFDNGSTDLLHAGEAKYWLLDGNTPVIQWSQYSVLIANKAPISIVTGTLYGAYEPISGTYPVSLQYQTNVGNNVPLSGSTTSIVNDGNVAGQSVVEATQTGSTGSNVSLLNDGTLVLSSYIAGVLAQFFKSVPGAVSGASVLLLGDSARQVEVLGALKVDGTVFTGVTQIFGALTAKSTTTLDNGAITTNGAGNITTSGLLTVNNNTISVNLTPTPLNGATSGTATAYMDMTGTLKRCIIWFNAFRNGGASSQNLSIPVPFTTFARFTAGDTPGLQFNKAGVAQNLNIVSTANGTPQAATTNLNAGYFYGDILGGFDTVNLHGSGASNHTGTLEIIGV